MLILGAGNAAVSLAARLKALGVCCIMAEKNAKIGDNWALRHDNLKFHVPTSFCEMPYLSMHVLLPDDQFDADTVQTIETNSIPPIYYPGTTLLSKSSDTLKPSTSM